MEDLQKKERTQNFTETGVSRYIYQRKLDKDCFQNDMANGDFKDLTRRTASGKIFCNEAFNIAKNPKYDGYQSGLTSNVYKFFDKKLLPCVKINLLAVLLKMKNVKPTSFGLTYARIS